MEEADARARFEELYHATYRQVLAYCRRRTRSSADADDAAAATFTVAWQRVETVLGAEYPLAWLYAVAYRTLSNQRRAGERRHRLRIRLRGLGTVPTETPDRIVESATDVQQAFLALSQLPSRDQELIRLAAFENLTYAEMAAVMGTSESSVRSRLYRARGRLRASYEQLHGGFAPEDGGE